MSTVIILCLAILERTYGADFQCLYLGSCEGSTKNCPSGEDCTVTCDYIDACYSATINCPPDANCNVRCSWVSSCKYININCPTNGNCNIQCTEDYSCHFAEVTWSPDPYTNTLNCGEHDAGCLADFTVPPTKQPTSVTQNPSIATSNPTAAPSFSPTPAPTMNPTQIPSAAPSNIPTTDPTADPTTDPINDPTTEPTVNPSASPIISPTKYPTTNPIENPTKNPSADPTENPATTTVEYTSTAMTTADDRDTTSSTTATECNEIQRTISWVMYLVDDIDINSSTFQQQFGAMILEAAKQSILVRLNTKTWEWCLQLVDFTVSYVNNRRRLLATEVNVEAVFNYDNDLESDAFEDEQDRSELMETFRGKIDELSQEKSFMREDGEITNISMGNAVNIAPNEMTTFDHVTIAIVCLVGIALLLIILGYTASKVRGADDFKYAAVILFGIYTWDFFSDVLFAVDIWLKYLSSTPETDIPFITFPQNVTALMLSVIFGCSVAFIVLPLLKNFYDLIKFQGYWQKHPLHGDRYRMWLDEFGTFLFFLSFACGSTFGSIALVNSNLFGKRVFSMGLSKLDLRQFNQRRLVNVIMGENLPQLLIQIFYASVVEGGVTTIAFAAIVSSTLSICAAVLDFASKKKLLSDDGVYQTLFSVKVASTEEIFSRNQSKFKHKTKRLIAEIARIFPLDRNAVEILPIEKFSGHEHDGLVLYFFISTSKFEPIEIYNKLNANNQTHLAKQIGKAWGLNHQKLTVYDLEFLQKSQRLTVADWKTMEQIQLSEHINTHQTIAEESDDDDDDEGGNMTTDDVANDVLLDTNITKK